MSSKRSLRKRDTTANSRNTKRRIITENTHSIWQNSKLDSRINSRVCPVPLKMSLRSPNSQLIGVVTDLETSKRPKLEGHPSAASTGTASSGASLHGIDTPGSSRADSSSNLGQWPSGDGHSPPQPSSMSKLNAGIGPPKGHGSPVMASPTLLPGFRESIFGGNHQSLPWRDGPRDDGAASLQQFSRVASVDDRQSSHSGAANAESRNLTGSVQHSHRTGHSHPPPLLTSESTNRSTASSSSTGSSAFFTPRTPMEPSLDRAMPLPSLYSQKSNGTYENQLPPLRPPSLSPQTTILGSQQSPTGMYRALYS
jgi:hypothetical protein